MFNTKIGNNNLTVTIEEEVRKSLVMCGVSPAEIYKLIVNFAGTLLASKKDDEVFMTNDETGASLVFGMQWSSENDVAIHVKQTTNIAKQREQRVNLATPQTEEIPAN